MKPPPLPGSAARLAAARAALQPKGAPSVRPPAAKVIQCVFSRVSIARIDAGGAHALAIRQFIDSVLNAVDKAYQYVLADPTLGVLAGLDGHTQHWVQRWREFVMTGRGQLMSAAFGYAIETVATHIASPFRPTAPPGMSFMLQGERGGTRPDIILTHGDVEIAWLDITASDSNEHIFTQKIGWMDRVNVAEVTYPSTEMAAILAAPRGAAPGVEIDANEIFRNMAFQRYYLERLRRIFAEQGEGLFGAEQPPRGDPAVRDEIRRRWTLRILRESGPLRGIALDERAAANILYAMGLSPTTYGFRSSTSRSTGEHLLRAHEHVPLLAPPPAAFPFGELVPVGSSSSSRSQPRAGVRTRHARSGFRSLALRQSSAALDRVQGISETTRRLGRAFGSLSSGGGFTIQSLYRSLGGSGAALQSIRACRLVVTTRESNQLFYMSYSRAHRSEQIRRIRGAQAQALEGGGHAPPSFPGPSSLALLSPQAPLGEIVVFSPAQQFQLVAYEVETEEGEVISGVNGAPGLPASPPPPLL